MPFSMNKTWRLTLTRAFNELKIRWLSLWFLYSVVREVAAARSFRNVNKHPTAVAWQAAFAWCWCRCHGYSDAVLRILEQRRSTNGKMWPFTSSAAAAMELFFRRRRRRRCRVCVSVQSPEIKVHLFTTARPFRRRAIRPMRSHTNRRRCCGRCCSR